MKSLALIFILSFAPLVSQATCLGEAQIIAKVESVNSQCVVMINPASVRFYAESGVCPLDLSDVLHEGVYVDSFNNNCSLKAGDVITGVLVRTNNSQIILDNH